MNHTGFFYDERCFWHSTGAHATIIPVGGWVQPPADAGHTESPESKRRLRNLLDVSGLLAQLDVRSAPPAPVEALVRIHPMYYLREFKRISESGGGTMGEQASPGPDSYHYATLSAGRGICPIDGRQRTRCIPVCAGSTGSHAVAQRQFSDDGSGSRTL